jgi:hypothetical protein
LVIMKNAAKPIRIDNRGHNRRTISATLLLRLRLPTISIARLTPNF